MRYIDPDVMLIDDYKLKQDGEIESLKRTDDKKDVFYATDKGGKVDETKSITVEKGVLDNVKEGTTSTL